MNIPGYCDQFPDDIAVAGLTFDGAELLGVPGVWAAHLAAVVDDEDVLIESWGLPAEAIEAAYQRLTDETAWPVFTVELTGDARLAVVYRNFADDAGKDYLLLPGGGRPCIEFASIEGPLEALVSENVFFARAEWSTADGVVVCDQESCPRNPADRSALKPDDLRTVSDLLAAAGPQR